MHSEARPHPVSSQENAVIRDFWTMKTEWLQAQIRVGPTSNGVYTDTADKSQTWGWILLRPQQKVKYNYALLIIHKEKKKKTKTGSLGKTNSLFALGSNFSFSVIYKEIKSICRITNNATFSSWNASSTEIKGVIAT